MTFAVAGLLSLESPASATVQVVSIDRLELHPGIDASETDVLAFDELVESVVDLGVLAPILARVAADGEHFEILDGARRWRAARAAGHTVVPVIVHHLEDDAARRFVALGRVRRPIPYTRLMAGGPGGSADRGGRVPVVISGPAEGGPSAVG